MKLGRIGYEFISEMIFVLSIILITILFTSDSIFQQSIKNNPSLFALFSVIGLSLAILMKMLKEEKFGR